MIRNGSRRRTSSINWIVVAFAAVVDLEHPNAGAIVDGRELVEAPPAARDAFEKLDVDLQPIAGLGILVALPALLVGTTRGNLGGRRGSAPTLCAKVPCATTRRIGVSQYRSAGY
jgi:hypothetical protein